MLVEVEVDELELLSEINDTALLAEVEERQLSKTAEIIYEKIYYALRDGDIEKAIEATNPLLELKIGRRV